jgi:thiol:disulfide interchange protein DsbD
MNTVKNYTCFIALLFFSLLFTKGYSQQRPVRWNYSVKKISDKLYEVHLKAVINDGWHIYSQEQPKDAIGLPTTVKFTANPLLSLKGNLQEKGKLEKVKNEDLGMENHQYQNEVEFVQVVAMKANVKTNITGNIEFMACTDERCLPSETISFSLQLQ